MKFGELSSRMLPTSNFFVIESSFFPLKSNLLLVPPDVGSLNPQFSNQNPHDITSYCWRNPHVCWELETVSPSEQFHQFAFLHQAVVTEAMPG